jgi:4-alpha-glucanotransferase
MDRIAALAAEWGLEPDYFDARGTRRTVPQEALRQLLAALSSLDAALPCCRPQTWIWRQGLTRQIDLAGGISDARWRLTSDGGDVASGRSRDGRFELPWGVPAGAYRIAFSTGAKAEQPPVNLIVAPTTAYQLDDLAPERIWLLAVPLYAVRSRQNWGHGDFTDLIQLVRLAAEVGAAGIGLNPLHALLDDRPEQASPYSPNSRLFLNPPYIDLAAVPEFPGLFAAGLEDEVARLRNTDIVDYRGVSVGKGQALRLAYQRFCAQPDPSRKTDFDAFRTERGVALARFAAFETLRRRFRRVWWEWPTEWREPTLAAIEALRAEAADEIGYHEFVQWLADRQLAACQAEARRLKLPVGLYLDVAVGIDPSGADAWSEQSSIVPRAEVGAPPDLLNTAGQAWGLAAFNPRALEAEAFAPFGRLLTATMRYAGAVRLDHVLGLNRLYLIPLGFKPQDGAYVRYPLQALLAVVALESARHRCLVIGEDLGTVPEELRGVLADWGVWSYLVMLFERRHDGAYRLAHEYRRNALITFGTHDLPTFAGWCSGHDLRVKREIGLDPGETDGDRDHARALLADALLRSGLGGQAALEIVDVVRFLARMPSRVLAVSIEDVLGLRDQLNIPGTVHQHPNWRRRLPLDVEDLFSHGVLRTVAAALAEEGRDYRCRDGRSGQTS